MAESHRRIHHWGELMRSQADLPRRLDRRSFLILATLTASGSLLAACSGSAPPAATAPTAGAAAKPPASATSAPAPAAAATTQPAQPAAAPATSAPAAGGTQRRGGALVIGFQQDQPTLDAPVPNSDSQVRLLNSVLDPLVWESEPGKFVPGLAESWEVSPDAKTYTFTLRQGVTFHDGTPFNAAAVKVTFDRIVDPALKALKIGYLGPYDGTDVVSDNSVRVRFKQTFPLFLHYASTTALRLVSPTAVEKFGQDFGQNLVGTGPFKLNSFGKDKIVFDRFEAYNWGPAFLKHDGPAQLDSVTYRIIPEDATRLTALERNEIQIADFTPPQEVKRLQGDQRFRVDLLNVSGLPQILQLNVEKAPSSDKVVRQAIQYAINHQDIVDNVWFGLAKPAYGVLASATPGYWKGVEEAYPFSPDKARTLLDQAGWQAGSDGIRMKDGARLELLYVTTSTAANVQVGQIIQAMLSKVGIDMKIDAMANQASLTKYQQNEHNIGRLGEINSDPSVMAFPLHSRNISGGTQGNRSRYSNPQVDKLLDDAEIEMDWTKRLSMYEQVQNIASDDAIIIGGFEQVLINTVSAKVTDMTYDVLGSPYLHTTQLSA
jgi:peptide/nickel transport system substrate-binding protein